MRVWERPVLAVVVAVLTAVALVGCSGTSSEDSAASTSEAATTRMVATEQGDVEVPADPQRIVVLNQALAGYFFALDVPVHATIRQTTTAEEDFPETWAAEATEAGTVILPWSDALRHRTDAEAVALLVEAAQGTDRLVVVEGLRDGGLRAESAAEHALLDLALTGAPTRVAGDVERLALLAGWVLDERTPLGWEHHAFVFTRLS